MLSFQKGRPYARELALRRGSEVEHLARIENLERENRQLLLHLARQDGRIAEMEVGVLRHEKERAHLEHELQQFSVAHEKTAASCYARSRNYAIILRKPKSTTKPRLRNSSRIWLKQKKSTKRKSNNCRIASCKSTSFFTPEVSALPKVSRAHKNCKTVCEDSCKLRNGLAGYWTTPATQQFGFALRSVGKLETRSPP